MYVYYKWFGSPATIFGAFLSLYEWPCPVQRVQAVTDAVLVDFRRSKTAESDQLDMPFLRVCFYRLSHHVTDNRDVSTASVLEVFIRR